MRYYLNWCCFYWLGWMY